MPILGISPATSPNRPPNARTNETWQARISVPDDSQDHRQYQKRSQGIAVSQKGMEKRKGKDHGEN